MTRKIISIDESKCNGCGLCITGCHEGALALVNGIATLVKDSYCDGLGACLPACPVDAIHLIERDADEFDEQAVTEHLSKQQIQTITQLTQPVQPIQKAVSNNTFSCPGTAARAIERKPVQQSQVEATVSQSELQQWPCQIKLVPVNAPYFKNANLLIAADCSAFAYANFHQEFMRNKITIIGCPKLDAIDYALKLTEIIKNNDIKSVTVVRMEVPCCGGIENATKDALKQSGKMIPWQVVTISTDGRILE